MLEKHKYIQPKNELLYPLSSSVTFSIDLLDKIIKRIDI